MLSCATRASTSACVGAVPAMMTGGSVSDSNEEEEESDGKGYRAAMKKSSLRFLARIKDSVSG